LPGNFNPEKNNNDADERLTHLLRQDINSVLETQDFSSRRGRIMAQIRQEQQVKRTVAAPGRFRFSPYLATGLATLVIALGLTVFVLVQNNTAQRTATDNIAYQATSGIAENNQRNASESTNSNSGTGDAAGAALAPAPTPVPQNAAAGAAKAVTTAPATTIAPVAAPNTTAAATTMAAAVTTPATTAAATTAPPRNTVAPVTTAAGVGAGPVPTPTAQPAMAMGGVWPGMIGANPVEIEKARADKLLADYSDTLPPASRTTLQLTATSKLVSSKTGEFKFDMVVDYYRKEAEPRKLSVESGPVVDNGKIKMQWLYLQGNTEKLGVLLVEIKDQAAADAALGPGKAKVGETIILLYT
jgi:hypothetical protein